MPMRPNYRHERAERTRRKDTRKQEKLRKREERAAQRKVVSEPEAPDETERTVD